jgi:O-antigen/teichoic acid export membrane protein
MVASPRARSLSLARMAVPGGSMTRNVLANLLGRSWVSLVAILLTPSYLVALGVEGYGLIGAFAVIQTMLVLFDLGLGLTLNRELARLSAAPEGASGLMHSLLRTFEAVYWFVGILVGVVLVAAASFLSTAWFHPSQLAPNEAATAIALMGVTIAVQWPSALYSGGLLGLRRQVTANAILALSATLRGFGALAVLQFVPTISAFFAWQVFASVVQTILLRVSLGRSLPNAATPARFDRTLLLANASFAAGVTGITLLGAMVTQLDKFVLSSLVSLQDFGYYALAATVASGLYIFVTPVFNAAFPHLASASGDTELRSSYRRACQIGSLVLLPPAVTLVLFAPEALSAWLGNEQHISAMIWLVRILAAGTALNGLLNLPYALMLAARWTTTLLAVNLVALVVLVPVILILVGRLGPVGAAVSWLSYNLATTIVLVPLMHRRLLVGYGFRPYARDLCAPFLGALGGAALVRITLVEPSSRTSQLFTLILALCVSATVAWFLTKDRPSLTRTLKRYLRRDVGGTVGR